MRKDLSEALTVLKTIYSMKPDINYRKLLKTIENNVDPDQPASEEAG